MFPTKDTLTKSDILGPGSVKLVAAEREYLTFMAASTVEFNYSCSRCVSYSTINHNCDIGQMASVSCSGARSPHAHIL